MAVVPSGRRLDNLKFVTDAQGNLTQVIMSVSYDLVEDSFSPPRFIQRVGRDVDVKPNLNAAHQTAMQALYDRFSNLKDNIGPQS